MSFPLFSGGQLILAHQASLVGPISEWDPLRPSSQEVPFGGGTHTVHAFKRSLSEEGPTPSKLPSRP